MVREIHEHNSEEMNTLRIKNESDLSFLLPFLQQFIINPASIQRKHSERKKLLQILNKVYGPYKKNYFSKLNNKAIWNKTSSTQLYRKNFSCIFPGPILTRIILLKYLHFLVNNNFSLSYISLFQKQYFKLIKSALKVSKLMFCCVINLNIW